MLKLNLGSGASPMPDAINIDRSTGGEVFPIRIPRHINADFADFNGLAESLDRDCRDATYGIVSDCIDEIHASHVLEHFSHRQTREVLAEWVRVLKPGGRIRLAVPDFNWIVNQHIGGNATDWLEGYALGGHIDDNDHHGAIFTENKLRLLMRRAGLSRIRRWKSDSATECSRLPVSLNLEGFKLAPLQKLDNVKAVMSVPRYGATAIEFQRNHALFHAGIPCHFGWGVFWSEVLSSVIDEMLGAKDAPEFVLTLDYDTTFTADDVRELYRLMQQHPEADAITGLQMRRGAPAAILVMTDADGNKLREVDADAFDADLVPCESAHFGCTLIRASALRALDRPWFEAEPDKDGGWRGDGYVAADVQFWRNFKQQGKNLFLAPHVTLGHLEEVIILPDRNLQPRIVELSDFRRHGIPADIAR